MTKLNLMNILNMMMFIIIMMLISNYYLHPITMISLILIYSMLICMVMTLWSFNYIYSLMMFLIMISGVLILFLYFTSLISNEQHKISFYPFMSICLMITIYQIYKSKFLSQPLHQSCDQMSQMNIEKYFLQYSFKLYNYPYNYMTMMCILFLLMTLFLIIKISSLKYSSLRKIN